MQKILHSIVPLSIDMLPHPRVISAPIGVKHSIRTPSQLCVFYMTPNRQSFKASPILAYLVTLALCLSTHLHDSSQMTFLICRTAYRREGWPKLGRTSLQPHLLTRPNWNLGISSSEVLEGEFYWPF
jgi:hypothetical protein